MAAFFEPKNLTRDFVTELRSFTEKQVPLNASSNPNLDGIFKAANTILGDLTGANSRPSWTNISSAKGVAATNSQEQSVEFSRSLK